MRVVIRSIFSLKLVLILAGFSDQVFAEEAWPRITIITSLFKGENYIAQFLADITRQSVFSQCELIILNANPPGQGWEETIIRKYLQKYPKHIVYRRLPQDPGLYEVWNRGIKMARGRFITNANVDDRLAPDCYETHAHFLDAFPEVDLVYSDSYITRIPNETFELNSHLGLIHHPEFSPKAILKANLPSFNPMWRKSLHQKYGYFDNSFKIVADWEMWVRMITKGAIFRKVSGIHGLFYYNTGGVSLSKSSYDLQMQERERVKALYPDFFKTEEKL